MVNNINLLVGCAGGGGLPGGRRDGPRLNGRCDSHRRAAIAAAAAVVGARPPVIVDAVTVAARTAATPTARRLRRHGSLLSRRRHCDATPNSHEPARPDGRCTAYRPTPTARAGHAVGRASGQPPTGLRCVPRRVRAPRVSVAISRPLSSRLLSQPCGVAVGCRIPRAVAPGYYPPDMGRRRAPPPPLSSPWRVCLGGSRRPWRPRRPREQRMARLARCASSLAAWGSGRLLSPETCVRPALSGGKKNSLFLCVLRRKVGVWRPQSILRRREPSQPPRRTQRPYPSSHRALLMLEDVECSIVATGGTTGGVPIGDCRQVRDGHLRNQPS